MILTREELKSSLKDDVDYFLNLCVKNNSPYFQVVNMPNDRFLTFDEYCWKELCLLMKSSHWSMAKNSDIMSSNEL